MSGGLYFLDPTRYHLLRVVTRYPNGYTVTLVNWYSKVEYRKAGQEARPGWSRWDEWGYSSYKEFEVLDEVVVDDSKHLDLSRCSVSRTQEGAA